MRRDNRLEQTVRFLVAGRMAPLVCRHLEGDFVLWGHFTLLGATESEVE